MIKSKFDWLKWEYPFVTLYNLMSENNIFVESTFIFYLTDLDTWSSLTDRHFIADVCKTSKTSTT